ncbi:MAG: hypothetical protein ACI8QZ_002628 [Chlamydiales bacterium]|jgi:hypothetical protein
MTTSSSIARAALASAVGASLFTAPALAQGADGICLPDDQANNLCFVSPSGFIVEAVTGDRGEFPVLNDHGDSVFAYRITGPSIDGSSCQGIHDISHADIIIPDCADAPLTLISSTPEGQTLPGGDPSCGFGRGDDGAYVFKWDEGVACDGSETFSLVMAGSVPAAPTSFLLKAALDCDIATILGPDCGSLPFKYCEGGTNSVGTSGSIDYTGSTSISENNFYLTANGLPPNQPGYFFYGSKRIEVPFGNGLRCIGGNIVRYRKIGISVTGDTAVHMDFTRAPLTNIVPGVGYYFQLFYRDAPGGGDGFNTTDALCATFAP